MRDAESARQVVIAVSVTNATRSSFSAKDSGGPSTDCRRSSSERALPLGSPVPHTPVIVQWPVSRRLDSAGLSRSSGAPLHDPQSRQCQGSPPARPLPWGVMSLRRLLSRVRPLGSLFGLGLRLSTARSVPLTPSSLWPEAGAQRFSITYFYRRIFYFIF